jgi:2-amino-4-hydroxy-6-hydroxymethyldihydropteridine diphosphokinase
MHLADDLVAIGIGGNVGTQDAIVARFRTARDALAELGAVRSAPLYRTAPLGPAQPPFLNTAVTVRITDLQPDELIATVLEIERLLGRDREHEARWGPRPLDLDVLVWGERVIHTPALDVPHPRLAQRRFALAPLAELLGPDAVIPGLGRLDGLLHAVAAQEVEEIAPSW